MTRPAEIVIDGAYGEGGGQIVRSALALATFTGRPLKLVNIRGRRKKPGLRPQHLTAVQACASVCSADVVGARLNSRELSFTPGRVRPGTHTLNIGTAGAATLVLQTILPPLCRAGGESRLVVRGGTHVPWSPPFHHLALVFLPMIGRLGFDCVTSIKRWGWYPKGGGEIQSIVKAAESSTPENLDKPFELRQITGISASSRLPEHVRVRQQRQLQARLQAVGLEADMMLLDIPALDRGSFVFACLEGRESLAGFSSLGARGKPAEKVADEVADQVIHFLQTDSALDHHMADQILIYMAVVPGIERFSTSVITEHLLTNVWVVQQFLPVQFEIAGQLGTSGLVIKSER